VHRVRADGAIAADGVNPVRFALLTPPVIGQLVPGDADQPAGADLVGLAEVDGLSRSQERLRGEVLCQCPVVAPVVQVAVYTCGSDASYAASG